jgi:hypothetical protein
VTVEASWVALEQHTFNRSCPLCPGEHGQPARCDHSGYSPRLVRFILAHLDVYHAAYISWGSESVRNQIERLEAEYRTLPPRHDCTCWPRHCGECRKIDAQRPQGPDVAISVGRTDPVTAPMPSETMLDLAWAAVSLRDQLKRRPTVGEVVWLLNRGRDHG